MSTVDRLVGAFDFDGDRGLAALYHGDLLMIALDRLAMWELVMVLSRYVKESGRRGGKGR